MTFTYLTADGVEHDPAKAAEIILDASRHDTHALTWIKAIRRLACSR